jgi:hypothetical protein
MASIINAATSGGLVTTADTSGILQLQTAGTTAVTVNASQNMGVGTASPSVRLQVEGTTDATQRIVVNGSGNYSSLKLQYNATEVAQFQNYQNSEVSIGATVSAPLLLVTNNTERARIPAAGGIQSKTTISVGDATPSASGAGITFPATQSASTDANTLDDYEEGTWTPSIGGTATYSGRSGNYVKIGKVVYIDFSIEINIRGTGSTTLMTGMPFSCGNTVTASGSTSYQANLATSVVSIGMLFSNSTSIRFDNRTVASNTASQDATFQNGTAIYGCITYLATA